MAHNSLTAAFMNKTVTSEVRPRSSNKENIFPNSFKRGAARLKKLEAEND